MDLSKLPKLSDTKSQEPAAAPAEPAAPPAPHQQQQPAYQPIGIGGDIWISLIIGILLCLLGGTFARFAIAKMTHQPYHTGLTWDSDGPKGHAGDEIAYFDLPGYTAWSDMGIFLFGLILLFEAGAKTLLVLRPGNVARAALMLAVLLTIVGLALNLIACVKMYSVGIIPIISGLAVAFGGWILLDEWNTLLRTNPRTRVNR